MAVIAASVSLALLIRDRKSTRLNSSHANISYAVFCLKKKKNDLRSAAKQHRKGILNKSVGIPQAVRDQTSGQRLSSTEHRSRRIPPGVGWVRLSARD